MDEPLENQQQATVFKEVAMSKKARVARGRKAPPTERLYLKAAEAAELLGVSRRWLEGNDEIRRIDISGPGRSRPMWRYRRRDLERFVERCAKRQGGS